MFGFDKIWELFWEVEDEKLQNEILIFLGKIYSK